MFRKPLIERVIKELNELIKLEKDGGVVPSKTREKFTEKLNQLKGSAADNFTNRVLSDTNATIFLIPYFTDRLTFIKTAIEKGPKHNIPELIEATSNLLDAPFNINEVAKDAITRYSTEFYSPRPLLANLRKHHNFDINAVAELAIQNFDPKYQVDLMAEMRQAQGFDVNAIAELAIQNCDPDYQAELMVEMRQAEGFDVNAVFETSMKRCDPSCQTLLTCEALECEDFNLELVDISSLLNNETTPELAQMLVKQILPKLNTEKIVNLMQKVDSFDTVVMIYSSLEEAKKEEPSIIKVAEDRAKQEIENRIKAIEERRKTAVEDINETARKNTKTIPPEITNRLKLRSPGQSL